MFNTIFDKGYFPTSWGESVIYPIHKSCSKKNPGNYRSISLINTMYTLFSNLINNRLNTWVEENNILDEAQAGFPVGYSTLDSIFTLQAMVKKNHLSRPGKELTNFFKYNVGTRQGDTSSTSPFSRFINDLSQRHINTYVYMSLPKHIT